MVNGFVVDLTAIPNSADYERDQGKEKGIKNHLYIHILTHTYTYLHILTHTYTYLHILTHTYTYLHILTHTYTYLHIHTSAQ